MLEVGIWQKSNEGVKKSKQTPRPEFILPDFLKSDEHNKEVELHDTQDVAAILAMPRA